MIWRRDAAEERKPAESSFVGVEEGEAEVVGLPKENTSNLQ